MWIAKRLKQLQIFSPKPQRQIFINAQIVKLTQFFLERGMGML
jgi:hypothetical protein